LQIDLKVKMVFQRIPKTSRSIISRIISRIRRIISRFRRIISRIRRIKKSNGNIRINSINNHNNNNDRLSHSQSSKKKIASDLRFKLECEYSLSLKSSRARQDLESTSE
jgi:hypothetical protein